MLKGVKVGEDMLIMEKVITPIDESAGSKKAMGEVKKENKEGKKQEAVPEKHKAVPKKHKAVLEKHKANIQRKTFKENQYSKQKYEIWF